MAKNVGLQADYGNWMSKRLIYIFTVLTVILSIPAYWFWPLAILAAFSLLATIYFVYARYLFSPKGKNIQHQVWDSVISHLNWQGNGKALDIGCGNGAVTIKVAKKFPKAQVTAIDYWGAKWEYSQNQCEQTPKPKK